MRSRQQTASARIPSHIPTHIPSHIPSLRFSSLLFASRLLYSCENCQKENISGPKWTEYRVFIRSQPSSQQFCNLKYQKYDGAILKPLGRLSALAFRFECQRAAARTQPLSETDDDHRVGGRWPGRIRTQNRSAGDRWPAGRRWPCHYRNTLRIKRDCTRGW